MTISLARRLVVVGAVLLASPAHAQDVAMVLGQSLALLGLLGGLVAGVVAAWRQPKGLHFGTSFLVYLGVLCVVASTWIGSLDAVPLTLALGTAAGMLPYAGAFFGLRWCFAQWRARRSRSQAD